jgi:hypothetical protein
MGKIITQGKTTSRLIIQDKLSLYLIALIFNGEIRTPSKLKSFNEFLNRFNNKKTSLIKSRKLKEFGFNNKDNIFEEIKPYNKPKDLTLTDNWLIGFIDAEGCFHVSFSKKYKRSFKFLFDLSQKGEDNKEVILKKLKLLFGVGTINKHYHKDN